MNDQNIEESNSNLSVFNESFDVEKLLKENNENDSSKEKELDSENQKIMKIQEKFLSRKRRILSEEEKKERIQRNINRYCKRNEEMLSLLERINNGETTHKNINRMMRLLAVDLSDTKKLINKKGLIYNQKKEIFNRLLNFTFAEYQYFWFKLTDGKFKKGKAQLIKTSNISKAKEILKELEEKRIKNINDINKNENNNEQNKDKENMNNNNDEENKKKNRTIKEIIQAATMRDLENEKMDQFFENDSDLSSDNSNSSSLGDSDDDDFNSNSKSSKDNMNNKEKDEKKEKERNEKKEKEEKEKEEKEKKEKERKEREEKEKEEKVKKERERKEKEEKERMERERKEKEERERKEKEEREKKMKKLMEDEDEIDIFN